MENKNRIASKLNYSQFVCSFFLMIIILLHKNSNPSFSLAKNLDEYSKLSLLIYNLSEIFVLIFGRLATFLPIIVMMNSILEFSKQKKINSPFIFVIFIFISPILDKNNFDGGLIGIFIIIMLKKITTQVHLLNMLILSILVIVFLTSETYKRNKKLRKFIKSLHKKLFDSLKLSIDKIKTIKNQHKTDSDTNSTQQSSFNYLQNNPDEKVYFYKPDYQPKFEGFSDERGGFKFYRKPKTKSETVDSSAVQKIFANDLNQKLYEQIFEKKKSNFDNSMIRNNFHVKIQGNHGIVLEKRSDEKIHTSENELVENGEELNDYHERDDLLANLKENFYKIQNKYRAEDSTNNSTTSNPANDDNPHVNRVMFQSHEKQNFEEKNETFQTITSYDTVQSKIENEHLKNSQKNSIPEIEKKGGIENIIRTEVKREKDIIEKDIITPLQKIPKLSETAIPQQTIKESEKNHDVKTITPIKNTITTENNLQTHDSLNKNINRPDTSKINKIPPTIENKKNNKPFKLPDINFLSNSMGKKVIANHHQAQLIAEKLIRVLKDFSVYGKITNYHIGPVITLYEFEPLPGTKSSRVIGLCDDIARSLSATSARISVISGKNALGIELPNEKREIVLLKDVLESEMYTSHNLQLPIALGKNILGEAVIVDLAKMPHLLVAGTTGSGKSVAINTMIMSILYSLSPDECKFIMIDPKMLELSTYNGIPHLLTPVVTDPKKSVTVLKWVVKEMEERYRMMSYLGVRNVKNYNEKIEEAIEEDFELTKTINLGFDKQSSEPVTETISIERKKYPYIVVIVDEMADLMLVAGKEIEFYIQRLAQMARAAGIHIVMATQRPSVDVITGVIKANLPTRISFAVTSKIDSRTILGEQGAEQLLGMGDMLYMASGNKIVRIHGPFVSDLEVERVVNYLQSFGPPSYLDSITNQITDDIEETDESTSSDDSIDQDFQRAVELVMKEKKISISYIQRQLRIGYNKSANIVDRMEKEGIVTSPNHQGKRELIS